jgi:hypothetical protein
MTRDITNLIFYMIMQCYSKKRISLITRSMIPFSLMLVCGGQLHAAGSAAGPAPVVADGVAPPGAFPNRAVTGVNVMAKGSTAFDSNAEVTGFEGNGPVPWSINRYNRGDFSMRLAPADPVGANLTMGLGFTQFNGSSDQSMPENQAWRPSPKLGVVIPTARQNGPINWQDGEGDFYPTVAISGASSGSGYSMVDGTFGGGNLDINTGRAGTHGSSPEANFSYSVAWFPYDAGWLAGNIGNPVSGDSSVARWDDKDQHAAGLSAGIMTWAIAPTAAAYGGLGMLRLPGINATTDGMLFTTSSQGNSDVNIVGVAPVLDEATGASGWNIAVREDSAVAKDEVSPSQSQFEFVYVPYNAKNLIGGQIEGTTGIKSKSAGTFTVVRTGTGTYEMSVPGKTASSGTLLLQVADFEEGTDVPMASKAFLSYEFNSTSGKFVIQSRKTTSDTVADLADASFYVAWVDFAAPLAPPDGPRMRISDPVLVAAGTGDETSTISPRNGNLAANTDEPELLVVVVDEINAGVYNDPTTGNPAVHALMGYFYDPLTLTRTKGPFLIMGNSAGQLNRPDVKYNPVSKQYVVAANARLASSTQNDLLMVARVNPASVAGDGEPLAGVAVFDGLANGLSYDDVALAVSTRNGNFIVVAEHKVAGEGEGSYGVLFGPNGEALTAVPSRLDLAQSAGDEDDPDVAYLPGRDAFLYTSNTDGGPLFNHIVGSVIQTTALSGQLQISGAEQSLSTSDSVQGHSASMENPFNGQILTAYDNGNDASKGDLTYFKIGSSPSYLFSEAKSAIPYFNGTNRNPFTHRHPQLAADPDSGAILIGHSANNSSVGLPDGYVFSLYDSSGVALPSQLGTPYFMGDSPAGQIDTDPNFHKVVYDRFSGAFIAVWTGGNAPARATYLASVSITSTHFTDVAPDALDIKKSGTNITLTWPAIPGGRVLKTSINPAGPWAPVAGQPVQNDATLEMTVPVAGARAFFRLEK